MHTEVHSTLEGGPTRIARLDLTNFKAFETFSIQFGDRSYLVGPNNAGKSTILSALRACAYMIRFASSRSPDRSELDRGSHFLAYSLDPVRLELDLDNLRHEFRVEESRLRLRFSNGSTLSVVWPKPDAASEGIDDEDEIDEYDETSATTPFGFFYIRFKDGSQPRRPIDVRRGLPRIGVVPILTPIETRESLLSEDHVRANIDRRLASKHFRNQLYWQDWRDTPYSAYRDEVHAWLPELSLHDLRQSGGELDVFFEEIGSRVEKEICWAGDGIQVWLQIVFHLQRLREHEVIVLDEPEVFLHPDLQRRLVRLLDARGSQVITSSHSAEILSEASSDSILWVDKTQRKALKAPPDPLLSQLARALGIEFNLRLARALRTHVALFVEGDDMSILRNVARTLDAKHIADELGVAEVSIKGFGNWPQVEAFGWLARDLLEGSVATFVILDGDYRSGAANDELMAKLAAVGVRPHIWARKELESYLLDEAVIARLSGTSDAEIRVTLDEITEGMRAAVLSRRVFEEQSRLRSSGEHPDSVAEAVTEWFDEAWQDARRRLYLCPAKDVLSLLNKHLQSTGRRAVSPRAISRSMRAEEIPDELASLLRTVDSAAREFF